MEHSAGQGSIGRVARGSPRVLGALLMSWSAGKAAGKLAELLPAWVEQHGDEDAALDPLTEIDGALWDIVEYIVDEARERQREERGLLGSEAVPA